MGHISFKATGVWVQLVGVLALSRGTQLQVCDYVSILDQLTTHQRSNITTQLKTHLAMALRVVGTARLGRGGGLAACSSGGALRAVLRGAVVGGDLRRRQGGVNSFFVTSSTSTLQRVTTRASVASVLTSRRVTGWVFGMRAAAHDNVAKLDAEKADTETDAADASDLGNRDKRSEEGGEQTVDTPQSVDQGGVNGKADDGGAGNAHDPPQRTGSMNETTMKGHHISFVPLSTEMVIRALRLDRTLVPGDEHETFFRK